MTGGQLRGSAGRAPARSPLILGWDGCVGEGAVAGLGGDRRPGTRRSTSPAATTVMVLHGHNVRASGHQRNNNNNVLPKIKTPKSRSIRGRASGRNVASRASGAPPTGLVFPALYSK